MSSSNKIVGKGQGDDYQRWEVPNVSGDVGLDGIQPVTAEQIEQIQKAAYEEAYGTGIQEGRNEGMRGVQAEVTRLGQICQALAEPLRDVDDQVIDEMTLLAIAIAKLIIRRELQTNPDEIVPVVREALSALPSSAKHIKVFLHPEDSALIRELWSTEGDERWEIVEETIMTRGGCRVESDSSRIDASLDKRISAIAAELLGGERSQDEHGR